MRLNEVFEIIIKKTGMPISQSAIAKGLSVTRQTINNRIRSNSEVTVSEIRKLEEYFSISILQRETVQEEFVAVDYYPEVFVSCGNGTVSFSDEKILVRLPKSLFFNYSPNKEYSVIHAKGDSMLPFITNDDKLIVEHWDNSQIEDNKIYVFCYRSEFYVKRLSKNVDEIIIKSDNPDYSVRTVTGEDMNELCIIGRVVGIMRNL